MICNGKRDPGPDYPRDEASTSRLASGMEEIAVQKYAKMAMCMRTPQQQRWRWGKLELKLEGEVMLNYTMMFERQVSDA